MLNDVLDFGFMYTIILLGTFLAWSAISILEQALYQVTSYTLPGIWSAIYTWGVANPTWCWNIFPVAKQSSPTYFL